MASQGGDKVEIIDTLDAGYYSSYYQDESFQQNENWPAAFAIYLAFFLTLIILAFLLDYSGYFDQYISKKVWKSHENLMEGIFLRRIANSASSPNPSFSQKYNDKLDEFRAQRMSNTDIEHGNVISSERTISVDPRQDRISNVSSHNGNTENNTVITNPVYRYCCCLCSHWMKGKEKLSEEYFTDLLERPAFLATVDRQDMLQDDGSNFFSKELLSDYWFYLMNNHNLFGMFLTVRGHPFSRADRRLAFFCQCCLALWIAVMFRQSSLNSVQQAAVKLFFISPMAVMINKYIYYMLSCPCLRNMKEHGGSRKYFAMCCEGFGKFAVLPSLALYLTALVVAAIYTPEQEEAPALLIAKFAYSIIIVTAFYECVYAYKHFITGRWYWELRICNICVFTLGKFFHEKIQHGFFLQPHQFVRQEGGCRGMISWVIEKQIIGTFEPETSTLIATSNEAVSSPTSSSEVPMEDENLEHNVANESKVDSTIVAQNVDVTAI